MADTSTPLDRYMAGDLSREEERALARTALDTPELFDALMTAGAMRAALDREAGATHADGNGLDGAVTPRPFWRAPMAAGALAAAAAVLLFAVVYPLVRKGTASPAAGARLGAEHPATANAGLPVATTPVALSAPITALAGISPAEFRSARTGSRPPKTEGAVSVSEDGDAVVSLGSLDGVTQGAQLEIFRENDRSEAVARMTVAAVFREQSRGRLNPRVAIRKGDVALVSASAAVAALYQHMVALIGAGDVPGARAAGQRALPSLEEPGVSVADKRRLLTLLGAMERRTRQTTDAVSHLRAAAELLQQPPAASAVERADVLNELGAALIDSRKPEDADRVLRVAEEAASGVAKARIENNLAAAAALRGDRSAAERLYQSALRAATDASAPAEDRRVIEKNLTDVATVR